MNRKRSAMVLVAAAASVALFPLPAARAQSPMTPMQLARMESVTGVWPSADGRWVAFTQSVPRGPEDSPGGSRSHLFLMSTSGDGATRALVSGSDSASGVAFHPDSSMVTVRRRGDGDAHPEVWGFPVAGGGEARRLTTTPHGVSAYAWRPDGGAIAYTVLDPMPEGRAAARAAGFQQIVKDEDYRHISLWIHDVASGRSRRMTNGQTVYDMAWSPDGAHLALAIAPRNLVDDSYMAKRLYLAVPAEDRIEKLVDNPGKLGSFSWSPDGRTLAYISAADDRDPHAGMLYTQRIGDETPTALTPDFEGMVHRAEWFQGDRGPMLLAGVSQGLRTGLVTIDPENGQRAPFADRDGLAFTNFRRAAGKVWLNGSGADHGNELFSVDATGAFTRHTDSNPWMADVALGRQENLRFESVGGLEIEGVLIHPVGAVEGRRYPLVIFVHGGPEAHHSEGWLTAYSQPAQVMAGRGYVSWFPNYRASTGRGVAFAKEDHGDPMGAEYEDHVQAIAHLDRLGLIDPARVGIMGGSYGGYTAAWAATYGSEHFAAAVSFVPFVDIRTKWYTSDIPLEFYHVHYEQRWPHEQRGFLADRSPLSYAERCRTPLLLAGGTADPRVHPSQPHMLWRAVQMATNTPVRYVQYPGEGHGNRTSTNRYDYMVRSMRWLEHYLGEGDHRLDEPPPFDLDYGAWLADK